MNSILLTIIGAGSASITNLCFRKYTGKTDATTSANGYLFLFYVFSFLTSVLFYPAVLNTPVNFIVLSIGMLVGMLNVSLMLLTSKALKLGPSGLTFAMQNASAVFPGMLLFFFFGKDFGFSFSMMQFVGIGLVLCGLFLGVQNGNQGQEVSYKKWLKYAFACLIVQIVALTLLQARCVLFDCVGKDVFFSSLSVSEADDIWFMPGLFGMGMILQGLLFLSEKRGLTKYEATFGFLGGLFNFGSTCLLFLATKWAMPYEKAILFPCFAASVIIFCNVWANRLYKEDFKVVSTALFGMGIFLGMMF